MPGRLTVSLMHNDNVIPFERRTPPAPPADLDIHGALARCRAMLSALTRIDLPDEVAEACVIMLLVNLHDLLQRARALGQPPVLHDGGDDVAELVARCRNAACHVWGRASGGGPHAFRFQRITGLCPSAFTVDGKAYGCEYIDDIAIYYGVTRLYLKRHARRALDALESLFTGAIGLPR